MDRPKEVMLIDDNEPTNFIHKRIVTKVKPKANIIVHQKAREALSTLREGEAKPELIFLDINMPGMDGWQFLKEYESLEEEMKNSIIIVMLTTSLNPDDVTKSKNYASINGFENKPLTTDKLERILDTFFD